MYLCVTDIFVFPHSPAPFQKTPAILSQKKDFATQNCRTDVKQCQCGSFCCFIWNPSIK
ncbi:hypothetical protein HMPREF9162_1016 [Selenomonas sp. oral taxon 137 str. F0430]|nr:hypothetical protein HMPREF9162_1016 [Selenomonas sp. oral taxon 137 str. F0430]